MSPLDAITALEDHDLVAVDHSGQHCSCGVVAVFLEHYAAVGLTALGAPGSRKTAGTLLLITVEQDLAIRALLLHPTIAAARRLLASATTASVQRALRRRLTEVGLERLHTTKGAAPRLTDRRTAQDAAIRRLHARGLNDRQIAHELGINRRTVGHRREALDLAPNYNLSRIEAAA
jgi:DNA-binding NarL/FixJ family response regulator